ncbi:hypothetical protein L202_06394 [Cryptococcus amylolentus CBS 6039]|uniref:Cell division control protein 25 n=1 Tax=Cryptococcus amylolentus CBS 6039 TaxID=1295533 RepID=A0A1E3HHG7_9TREE|nr:hypothetical protein L202_06394 [Cryptococcus amylolentus CBS 6039]ODN75196.1 hypothetical protein L202_06394 [Cryptococcus amylolentus CBS 6039]
MSGAQHDNDNDSHSGWGDEYQNAWVRARFDFDASDRGHLTFRAGDIIQLLRKLDTGWWDGILEDTRGWFPSNYVEEISADDLHQYYDAGLGYPSRQEYEDGNAGLGGDRRGDVINADDLLRGSWGDDWGGAGLDQLAREMMENDEGGEDGQGFMLEAQRRKISNNGLGIDLEEFGTGASGSRDETTVKPTQTTRAAQKAPDTTPRVEREDAWIPSITPDGQVYYHNTQTGEDSWELPMDDVYEADDPYAQTDEQFFHNVPSSLQEDIFKRSVEDSESGEFAVPYSHADLPYPWIAKLSDDGREWFFHNRLTGQSQRNQPHIGDTESLADMGLGLSRMSMIQGPPAIRKSLLLQRRAVEDWHVKTCDSLRAVTQPPNPPTLGILVEVIYEALREVLEATVTGSAAEEEMSRAIDLGSEVGLNAALDREEGAIEAVQAGYQATLQSIRDLLASFGYVGPLDPMEELPRPAWTSDLALVGCVGVLGSVVHAAVTSKRQAESGLSVWSEVLRAATKLKDVVSNYSSLLFSGQLTAAQRDEKEGKRVEGWLGFDPLSLGETLGGKWGFGRADKGYRVLDQAAVLDCQKARVEFDVALQHLENVSSENLQTAVLEALRVAKSFDKIVAEIDIASQVDVDGDVGDWPNGGATREDDLQEYAHLVHQARLALMDLDQSTREVNEWSVAILNALSAQRGISAELERLTTTLTTAFRALPTLLIISREQHAAHEQGLIRGQIGIRSPKHIATSQHTRSTSLASTASRGSRLSDLVRRKVRGLVDEPEVYGDAYEARDRPSEMPSSASQSQASLNNHSGTRRTSASSSMSSLTYQPTESDGTNSQKGNRSSILRAFRRGRAGSDALDGSGRQAQKAPSKKLAKLLGEDMSAIPVVSVPPPQGQQQQGGGPSNVGLPTQPETPWYMMDDYVPGEIIFDDKGAVKAGTLRALVVRLTSHSITDTPFFQAFLLTFRSFTDPTELFEHLADRYYLPTPESLLPEQYDEWKNKKKWYIQLRVVNALRQWLDKHFVRAADEEILDKVEYLALKMPGEDTKAELMSKQLLQLVAKRRQGDPEQIFPGTSGSLLSPPAPLVPRVSGRPLRITDINPIEIARQLTIIEFAMFQKIKPSEFLSKVYQDEQKSMLLAPNIRKVIFTANVLAGWISMSILAHKDPRARGAVWKHWVQIGVECRNLNNFSSLAAITAGLNSAPIARLRRTREHVSQKVLAIKADIDRNMDSSRNFSNYKDMLKTVNPPCVPFLGFYLTALVFIEDGNKSFIKPGAPTRGNAVPPSNSSSSISALASGQPPNANPTSEETVIPTKPLINFFKRSMSAEILRDIAQYQSQPYRLARSRVVQDFMNAEFERVHNAPDAWELSQELEPKEKDDERITRMLHDSVSGDH